MTDDFERVRQSFSRQSAMGSLGIEIAAIAPGKVELVMPFNGDFTQQHGFMHAGVITTAMDSAAGYAAYTLMPDDASVLTIEFKSNFLAPADGDSFRFVGEVVKPGRTITVTTATAYAVKNGQEKAVATFTGTMMAVAGRANIKG